MMQRRRCLGTLSAMTSALVLSACASAPSKGARIWSGRLAVAVQDTPAQNFSASFELQGNPEAGRLTLLSALGTTLANVQWSAQGAQWQRSSEWESRPNLGELTRELLGTELPVTHLFAWLRGEFTRTEGWVVDLSRHAVGRIQAQRENPLPRVELRVVFEP
jgi:outer membrane lipoprotein LolB